MSVLVCVREENSVSIESALSCFAHSSPKSKPLSRSLNANIFIFFLHYNWLGTLRAYLFLALTYQLVKPPPPPLAFKQHSTPPHKAVCRFQSSFKKKLHIFTTSFWADTRQVRPVWQRKSNIKISLITYSNYGLRSCLFDLHSWNAIDLQFNSHRV